jgi:hypothetical protein
MLEAALQYAARGWPVFAIGRSKIPFKGSHGFKDATTDPAVLEAMWQAHPGANVALATGRLVVFDLDGNEGMEAFLKIGPLVRTRAARTPRGGWHLYYESPDLAVRSRAEPRAKGAGGIDIRAHGGLALLPPSYNRQRISYSWANDREAAPLPDHLKAYVQDLGVIREDRPKLQLPAYLANREQRDLVSAGLAGFSVEWSAHEEARIRGALKFLKENIGYDGYFKVVAALHNLNWDFNGEDRGFMLLDEWASGSPYYNLDGLEKKWASIEKNRRIDRKVTIGTLFTMATKAGWSGQVEAREVMQHSEERRLLPETDKTQPPVAIDALPGAVHANVIEAPASYPPSSGTDLPADTPKMNGHASADALFAPMPSEIVFPDTDKAGNPRATCTNAAVAIHGLGIDCRKDVFHEKMLVGGHAIEQWAGDLSDDAVHMLRRIIWRKHKFDPTERHARDAAIQLCLENQYNPVADYLAGLKWDGKPRIARWTVDYLGAADTVLNREFGRLMLIAAVRRVHAPGTKFDQIVVLEGKQGTGKSSAIRILAGDDNFSDQHVLGASDKEQQEAFRGVWLHEIAELAGMRRTDVERIKQFARRTEDRARPAYGRMRVDMKRRGIFVATTNDDVYLKEHDRAFWPIATGRIDLERLKADRDQLWAEAATCEARGDSIALDKRLWAAVAREQQERIEVDAWENTIATVVLGLSEVSVNEILTGQKFLMHERDIGQSEQNRVARILKRLGFSRFRAREGDKRPWRYRKMGPVGPSGDT